MSTLNESQDCSFRPNLSELRFFNQKTLMLSEHTYVHIMRGRSNDGNGGNVLFVFKSFFSSNLRLRGGKISIRVFWLKDLKYQRFGRNEQSWPSLRVDQGSQPPLSLWQALHLKSLFQRILRTMWSSTPQSTMWSSNPSSSIQMQFHPSNHFRITYAFFYVHHVSWNFLGRI